jgi:ubiquinone/menaquinone biosynthesis C-methylase UbiE
MQRRMLRSDLIFQALALPYELITNTRIWEQHCSRMAQELPEGARHVLDVGCGPGNSTVHLPPGSIGGDPALAMLRRAQRRGVPVVCLSGSALPIRSGSLDAATFHSVLYLLPERQETLREVARALRPGGRVVLLEPQRGKRAIGLGLLRALPHPRWAVTAALWRTVSTLYGGGFSVAELRGHLEGVGLRVLRIEEALGGLGLRAVAEKPG